MLPNNTKSSNPFREQHDRLIAGESRLLTITRDNADEKFPFRVTFTINRAEFTVNVTAAELQTFKAFQRAALDRANVMSRRNTALNEWDKAVDLAIAKGASE